MAKSKLKRLVEKQISLVFNKIMGSGLAQEENDASGERYITPGMPEQVRKLASEGIVLLKNRDHILPIAPEQTVSVFGRIQHDWFYVGYGSGGDVHPPYEIPFFEALTQAGIRYNEELKTVYDTWCQTPDNEADHGYWGHWPFFQEEMPVTAELVQAAREKSDLALIILGRAAGEDRENRLEPGSYYLTEKEKNLLKSVTEAFDKTILLCNCGSVMDLSFLEEYDPGAVVYAWQLGQETAHAVADVLSGKVNPSGKLPDTIAASYDAYPSSASFGGKAFNCYREDIYVGYRYFSTFAPLDVLFPFGFGLSYTSFQLQTKALSPLSYEVTVTNVGDVAGKEVVQLYVEAPQGSLGKAKRVLAAYEKTALLEPGQSQTLRLETTEYDIASFDDSGLSGLRSSFVLEAGTYTFYIGTDCTVSQPASTWVLPETRLVRRCREVCIPDSKAAFQVLNPQGAGMTAVTMAGDPLPARLISSGSRDLAQRIRSQLPAEIPVTGDKGITLDQVASGEHSLEDFIAQLSDRELADLTRGQGMMNSPLGMAGNAGAFGGITEALQGRKIPPVITADGPAGLRIKQFTTLLPCGTAIAASWNKELVEETFTLVGQEAQHFGVDMNLAPGMNLHRDPLCGRNFEYYSEDPMLSGRTAAAAVRGLQKGGTSACPKHFACNNQEYNRNRNDSRLSVRALRELYLKNFEYCVREGQPRAIMTSYNKVNGVWSHYNYDLVTTVLRQEWGFSGVVITDWWMQKSASPEFPQLKDNAYRTRAQVDVLMPGSLSYTDRGFTPDKHHLDTLGKPDGLTRGELQRCAANVLRFILTQKF